VNTPTQLPGLHDSRSPETARTAPHDSVCRVGLLSSPTLSIGSLMLKCNFEIQRVAGGRKVTDRAGARPAFRVRLRRMVRLVSRKGPRDLRPGSGPALRRSQGGVGLAEQAVPDRSDRVAIGFWAALDPTERDAFRSVAISRTFAAGDTLIAEGDHADHVVVILSGRVKICVGIHGVQRVIAERGPGQLVGERGALRIGVRSASVIALYMVRGLVVRTADFASFVSAHPRVLAIVEDQIYDRLDHEAKGGAGNASYLPQDDGRRETATAAWFGASFPVGHPAQQVLIGENCTVILSDVVGFGARSRTDEDRRVIREALFGMTHAALQDLPDTWSWDDRGDGLLTIVPPSVPTALVIRHLHEQLPAALREHNRAHRDPARIRLRVGINVGPVVSDTMGVTGEAIIITARLVEAPLFKEAMARGQAGLGIIASAFIYDNVIRHDLGLSGYSLVQADVKESSLQAWMKLFGPPDESDDGGREWLRAS
jgi:hypothetical protein